jgi:hypothetical protein
MKNNIKFIALILNAVFILLIAFPAIGLHIHHEKNSAFFHIIDTSPGEAHESCKNSCNGESVIDHILDCDSSIIKKVTISLYTSINKGITLFIESNILKNTLIEKLNKEKYIFILSESSITSFPSNRAPPQFV